MKILALELSTGCGSIAFDDGTTARFETTFANDRKHSGLFFEHLQRGLQQFGRPELIVVGLGPGSYAGTRIAIAAATGLQAATGARLTGLSSLRAIATDAEQYCVIGDARRESFFFARVVRRDCVEGPILCTREELLLRLASAQTPIFSAEPIAGIPHTEIAYPSATVLAEIARAGNVGAADVPLEPIYLREPHITQPKQRPSLLARQQ